MFNKNPFGGEAPQVDPDQAIRQFAGQMGGPQRLVQRFYGFVPQQIQNSPDQIIDYLVRAGRVSPQEINGIRAYLAQKGIKM